MQGYKDLRRLYSTPHTSHSDIHSDTLDPDILIDLEAFGRLHDIDGHKVPGVLVRGQVSVLDALRARESGEGISQMVKVLYVRRDDIDGVTPEQPVRLDGKIYTVRRADEVQGVLWRIELGGYES